MDSEVRFIDLRQFFRYLKSKIVVLLAAAVICGGLLAGYGYLKRDKGGNTSVDLINLTMTQNHDAYYLKNVKYSDAVPYSGIYNSSAKLYVDFDYSDIENYENANISDINSKLESDALMLVWDLEILGEIIDELDLRSCSDMKDITPEKLQWLVNKNFQGAHVMNIVVSDTDPERARSICTKLVEKVTKKASELGLIDSIKVISEASLPEDNGLFGTAVAVAKKTGVDKKALVKKGIIGMIGGVLLAGIIMFVIYIIRDVVRSDADMKTVGLESITGAYRKAFDHGRAAGAINLSSDEIKNILVVAVDNSVKAEEFTGAVQKKLKSLNSDKKLSFAEDFRNTNDALEKVKESDAVVYLVRYNKTKLADIAETRRVLEKSGTKCLGGIII